MARADPTRPINIYSGERGLGGALTMPTELSREKGSIKLAYTVKFAGVVYKDAESAYLAHRCGDDLLNDSLMAFVVAERFRQHPLLALEVERRGGGPWLASCTHFTSPRVDDGKAWDGAGMESRCIRNLVEGWRRYERGVFHQPRQSVLPLPT